MTISQRKPASVKVICFGMCRTGTTSLRKALDMLGFGPCYHFDEIIAGEGKDFLTWCKVGDGEGTPQIFDELFEGYHAILDCPAAMYPVELSAAYPDAKFILSTRDPAAWEKSMKSTILRLEEVAKSKPVASKFELAMIHWQKTYFEEQYHHGRLATDAQHQLLEHNTYVQNSIPPEKLLVYDVAEGWDKLVKFLGVPKPTEQFPHLNTTAVFMAQRLNEGVEN